MVSAVGVNASQAKVYSLLDGATVELKASKATVYAAAAYQSEFVRASQVRVNYIGTAQNIVKTSQAKVYVAAIGRIFDPKVRVFAFTLDGHDYYVVRLGVTETLIFDTQTEQFYIWGSGDDRLWRALDGIHWPGGYTLANSFGSNVVVGDDSNGSIYFLDPSADQDDDAVYGADRKRDFVREVTGQYPLRGYSFQRCYGVQLYGSIGAQSTVTNDMTITLSYSDDGGNNYVSASPIAIAPEDFNGRIMWRSLGSIRTPGRLFKVTDYGGLKRIDGMNMITEGEGRT